MRTLRVFKLTDDAENRGIDWNNFDDTDIEEIAINAGYGDTDVYGLEWM